MTKRDTTANKKSEMNLSLNLLDEMIKKYFGKLFNSEENKPKLGDWLKMIELRRKLQPDEKPQAELWKKLDQVRQELLADKNIQKEQKSTNEQRKESVPVRSR